MGDMDNASFAGAMKEWIDRHLERQPKLPCRVDEMTPREQQIYKEHVAYHTGFLLYLQQRLTLELGKTVNDDVPDGGNRSLPSGLMVVGRPLPKIEAVRPVEGLSVEVRWDGGETETVDLAPAIRDFRHFSSLRHDRELFETVCVSHWGRGIEWGGGLIDMAASTVERLAALGRAEANHRRGI